jgi:anaerobic ribonucleoside-triphosphate reductase activating protein
MTEVAISRLHFPVHSLGPGRRMGIWFQGCSIRCPGCISLDTWAPDRGRTTVKSVFDGLAEWIPDADGATVSGGEPFDQVEALKELLLGLRARMRPDTDILIYSGYSREKLEPMLAGFAGLYDAIITDPYDAAFPQTLALRGSDNQRLLFGTELGRQRFASFERQRQDTDRQLDIMFDAVGSAWLAGIPARHDLLRLKALLEAEGTSIALSEDARFGAEGERP